MEMVVVKDKVYRKDIYDKKLDAIQRHDAHFIWAGVIGIILGILSIVVSIIPGWNLFLGVLLGYIALHFAIVGKCAYNNSKGNAALTLSIIGIVLSLVLDVVYVNIIFNILSPELQQIFGGINDSIYQLLGSWGFQF